MAEWRRPETLDAIFRPGAVAVIGASRREGSIGQEVVRNLLAGGFTGPVFPVNPHESVIRSLKCYPRVEDIPDPVDLAIIVVPRDQVLKVAEECGRKQVRGLVVITAGFKEVGGEGVRREQDLARLVARHRMRMVGPNCMGVFNTEERVRLNGSFARTPPLPGSVAMMSQSGALGEVLLEHAQRMGVGFSMFASVGNKTDISGNDLLVYWADDPRCEILLLYLESFGDPKRFTRIARQITRNKPILAVKSGRTERGARAAVSHTGALAGSDVAVDALFEQCGVLRVDSVPEMFDLALAFTCQPPPVGTRLAVVTNAGGPGILATDAAVHLGLTVAEFSAETRSRLQENLPDEASIGNPVDLLASADPSRYRAALAAVLEDPGVDAVLVIFVPPVMIDAPEVARAIVEASARHPGKPVLGCFMGQVRVFPELEREYERRVPFYPYPEEACRSLAAMARYHRLRTRPEGQRRELPVDRERASEILERALREGRDCLTLSESLHLVEAYGIPVVPWFHGTEEEILARAEELGFPVVLKGDVPSEVHKARLGLVERALPTRTALRVAMLRMASGQDAHPPSGRWGGASGVAPPSPELSPGPGRPRPSRFVLQKMLAPSREVLIGMAQDPVFGPIIGFGLGGVFAEVLKEVVFRIPPITDRDVREMIESIRGRELLTGLHGERAVDQDRLEEILQRISRLVEDFPSIRELDLNPVFASPVGEPTYAVDARVLLNVQATPD